MYTVQSCIVVKLLPIGSEFVRCFVFELCVQLATYSTSSQVRSILAKVIRKMWYLPLIFNQ